MPASLEAALSGLPETLRNELLTEFEHIRTAFHGRKWSPAELSGGRFCEIVYSVLKGHAAGTYPARAAKPPNFLAACQALERETNLPRSFRILIPRLLPALYEVRNNRGVGHVGGDVDPNFMDSSLVLSVANWVVSELVRELSGVAAEEAQEIVSRLNANKSPAVWVSSRSRRVLNHRLKLNEQLLLLIGSNEEPVSIDDLVAWSESSKSYVKRVLAAMHESRLVEFSSDGSVELLPPGITQVDEILNNAELI